MNLTAPWRFPAPFKTTAITGWVILVAILALGGWMRVTAVEKTVIPNHFGPDAWQYFNYAFNMRHYGVYSKDPAVQTGVLPLPDGFRTPGYPLFLAPFIDNPPDFAFISRVLSTQAWMSVLALLFVYFTARALLPTVLALLATFLAAISPHLITINHYLLTESLFTFFLVAGLSLMGWKGRWPVWFGAGMTLALAVLVRPVLFYFVVPAALLIVVQRHLLDRKKKMVAFVVGFVMVMTPWMVRNKISLGVWNDNSLMTDSIAYGIYPQFTYNNDPKTYGYPYRHDPRIDEIRASNASLLKELREKFTGETKRYLQWFLLEKPVVFWSWGIIQGQGDAFIYAVTSTPFYYDPIFRFFHRIMFSVHDLLVVLAALGSILVWVPRRFHPDGGGDDTGMSFMARMISLLLVYITMVHMTVPPWPRYNIPLRPMLYMMALFFLWGVFRFLAKKLNRV